MPERQTINGFIDLTGQRFSRLLVIERAGSNDDRKAMWRCRCDCGNEHIAVGKGLRNGNTKSCGCHRTREVRSRLRQVHGGSYTRLHAIWKGMLARCRNPNRNRFKYYGGRGITVCDEWLTFEPFRDWALANGYQDTLTIDRFRDDDHYAPATCQWITLSENVAKRNKAQARKAQSCANTKGDDRCPYQ